MKHYWLLLALSIVLGTTCAWTMNYIHYGHRAAFFGEITMDGAVTADNVMEKLKEYHSDSTADAELQGDPIYDFGAMAPGTKGSHEFVIKNVGKDALELKLGATTCKCTLGELADDLLAPGESTSVQLEWTVNTERTEFEQSAELRTNDPFQPAIQLVVRGLVIRELEFVPKQIPFGEVLSGEPFEFSTKMYSYYETDIDPFEGLFGSEELSKFAEVEFEPFEPSDEDGVHKRARQAFIVTAKVKPGVRQGPMLTTLRVRFRKIADQTGSAEATGADPTAPEPETDDSFYVAVAECAGRVIGALTMLETPELKSTGGGGYIWTLGRLGPDDDTEFSAFVALKGSERDSTNLTIGETYPNGVVEANIVKPIGKGNMRLFKLNLKLNRGEETLDLLGKNKDDFGWLWIESDNPKVSRMKVAVKVLIEPNP